MSSLREFLENREGIELKTFRESQNDQEQAQALAVRYTLHDTLKELKSIQLELLYKLQANKKGAEDASRRDNFELVKSYDDFNNGVLAVYRKLFGSEETEKIQSGEGIYKGLDNCKIHDVIEEVKL